MEIHKISLTLITIALSQELSSSGLKKLIIARPKCLRGYCKKGHHEEKTVDWLENVLRTQIR